MLGKNRNRRIVLIVAVLVLLAALPLLLISNLTTVPPPTEIWKPQPDRFPIGTVLQGSRVELSMAAFTQYRPPSAPAWVSKLPHPFENWGAALHHRLTSLKALAPWRLKIEPPPELTLTSRRLDYAPQGARVWLELVASTSRTGRFTAPLVTKLRHRSGHVQTLEIMVEWSVLPRPAQFAGHLLICQTPFCGYSTEDGAMFRAAARVSTTLAERRVQVDFLDALPASLVGYTAVLLAGDTLAGLQSGQQKMLCAFVQSGGRLILTPNAFFGSTVPCANSLLADYGLQVERRDAANRIESSEVAEDPLTRGVRRVSFHRPSRISVTDPAQGHLLVHATDGGGFVAVSRANGRGEVVVLTQSLWWSWVNMADSDNEVLLQNILGK